MAPFFLSVNALFSKQKARDCLYKAPSWVGYPLSLQSLCELFSRRIFVLQREKYVLQRTIYRAAYANGHDSIVLGAMGCGIFRQPPGTVADIFLKVLKEEFNGCFARVVFAILWDHNSQPRLVEEFAARFPLVKVDGKDNTKWEYAGENKETKNIKE